MTFFWWKLEFRFYVYICHFLLQIRLHCVKSVRVRSYSGLYFLAFGLNTDQNNSEYGHFLRNVRESCFQVIIEYYIIEKKLCLYCCVDVETSLENAKLATLNWLCPLPTKVGVRLGNFYQDSFFSFFFYSLFNFDLQYLQY